jgi:hypothetical protein
LSGIRSGGSTPLDPASPRCADTALTRGELERPGRRDPGERIPGVPGPDAPLLDTLVERAVRQAIAGQRPALESLIRARVGDELAALAGELVAAQLAGVENGNGALPQAAVENSGEPARDLGGPNGTPEDDETAAEAAIGDPRGPNGTPPVSTGADDAPAPAELCSRCGARPRLPERRICSSCKATADLARRRRARAREHARPAGADDDP